ncbi:MAG TPA: ABC transporter substrate-binding protein [Solirubrobacter sp.]|nr:ABC transporter substrate-binding protein [Solirubrobacter sp.]
MAVGLLTAGALAPGAATAATNVTVALGFRPDVVSAPYYVAQDMGYYKQAGLSVKLNYDKLPNQPQAVADGKKFQFGSASGDTALLGASKGAAVQLVAQQYEQYPVGAMWLAEGGPKITKPADLKGKKIGISVPGSSTDYGLSALLQAGHLKRSDVKVVAIGFAETEALINHQIDVAMTFTDNEPVQARALGHPVHVMRVAAYKNLVSTGVIAGRKLIKANPKLVTAFVKATMRGEKYTLQHPDAALKIALKRLPEVITDKQIATQKEILNARLSYQRPAAGHPVGWSNPKSWPVTLDFLQSIGSIPKKGAPSVHNVFTNTFTDQANVRM